MEKHIQTKLKLLSSSADRKNLIEREIVFEREHAAAGIKILSYFSEVLTKKHPESAPSVSIIQKGNKVTLRVETENGMVDEISETLDDYGLVVTGKKPVREFFEDEIDSLKLEQQLDLARTELGWSEKLRLTQEKHFDQRLKSNTSEIERLTKSLEFLMEQQSSLSKTIETLAKKSDLTRTIRESIKTIEKLAIAEETPENRGALESEIQSIKRESPTLYEDIRNHMQSMSSSVWANLVTPWASELMRNLPK